MLFDHPKWCITIELCGFSIEFLYTNYPAIFNDLRELINNGQIELISVTYAPQIWIAFPGKDLIKSIKINQLLLKNYGITPSRIFFTQENFFGIGATTLQDWFDVAVVKDDYYYHFNDHAEPLSSTAPFYKISGMKLLIGWGHILETTSAKLYQQIETASITRNDYDQLVEYLDQIDKANERFISNRLSGFSNCYHDVEWTWYHIGSSERFSKPLIHPDDFTTCKFNPAWYRRLESILLDYENRGFNFRSITDYSNDETIKKAPLKEPTQPLLDGAWNMSMSEGCLIWMGLNNKPHEDVLGIRNHNWLSRSRLVAIESLIKIFFISEENHEALFLTLKEAWKHQFLAEASDATGWYPEESEVLDSVNNSDAVLNLVADMASRIRAEYYCGTFIINTMTDRLEKTWCPPSLTQINNNKVLCPIPTFYGAQYELNYYYIKEQQQQIILDFIPTEVECGLKFPFMPATLQYSPALMENEIVDVDMNQIKPDIIYLALTNGLIGIGNDCYIIKHNEFMNIACCINKPEQTISYKIFNPKVKMTRWKFTLLKGTRQEALEYASSINVYPIVHL